MSATIDRAPVRSTDTPLVKAAAVGACGILLGFAGLQVALAAGAPLGEHVWGGTQDSQLPSTMGPRSPRPRAPGHLHRPHHHQRGAATTGRRPQRELRRPPMGGRQLHDRLRGSPPHRRQSRRPVRTPPCARRGARDLHGRVNRVGDGKFDDGLDRRPRGHGRRRCADHADHAVHPRQRVRRPSRTSEGHCRLDRSQRLGHRPRPDRRRSAHAQLLVVVRLLDQRAAPRRRAARRAAPRPRLAQPHGDAARPRRSAPLDRCHRHACLRHHHCPRTRLDFTDIPRRLHHRSGPCDRVRRVGAASSRQHRNSRNLSVSAP